MLCVDLTGPSTVITGNRAQKTGTLAEDDATAGPEAAAATDAAPGTA
jgi:hypothetical protein